MCHGKGNCSASGGAAWSHCLIFHQGSWTGLTVMLVALAGCLEGWAQWGPSPPHPLYSPGPSTWFSSSRGLLTWWLRALGDGPWPGN